MGIFDLFKRKNVDVPAIDIVVTKETYYTEVVQKTKGNLVPANIQNYVSESGGYVNYGHYVIVGKNKVTNRKNTKHYLVRDVESAMECAKIEGLSEPFDIKIEKMRQPTEKQLEYAKTLKAKYQKDVCLEDMSCIIDRIVDEDEIPPNDSITQYAHEMGVNFSKYIGEKALYNVIINSLNEKELMLFYVYIIFLDIFGGIIGDVRNDKNYNQFVQISHELCKDEKFLKSLKEDSYKYFHVKHKGTKLYKKTNELIEMYFNK